MISSLCGINTHAYGILASSSVFENGREEADFSRPAPERVLKPVAGRQRFELTSRLAGNEELRDLSSVGYRMVLERKDLVKGLVTTQTFDQAHWGRKVVEDCRDPFDGTRTFSWQVTWEYEDNFQLGLVPVRTATHSSPSGIRLSEVITTAYDPVRRRLTGRETTCSGQVRTNTWDYRWANPVEVETRYLKTVQEYNRDETETRSTTSSEGHGRGR